MIKDFGLMLFYILDEKSGELGKPRNNCRKCCGSGTIGPNSSIPPQGANPFLYAYRRQVEIILTRKLPPSSPLG
jgi:hypothetical protein